MPRPMRSCSVPAPPARQPRLMMVTVMLYNVLRCLAVWLPVQARHLFTRARYKDSGEGWARYTKSPR